MKQVKSHDFVSEEIVQYFRYKHQNYFVLVMAFQRNQCFKVNIMALLLFHSILQPLWFIHVQITDFSNNLLMSNIQI